ncbi:MAG: serine/threonine protein kinase, partial [Chloroflexi bacterium]
MALVLTAHDHVLDRQVAVKIVRPDLTWSSDAADTFIREARIIARLDHPHILHIYDLGTDRIGHKPLVYLVMQWASGGTLAHRLEAGPLPPDEVQKILQQVGDALDYAHRQGVIHLDLKPANILFDEHGNALVADFGLAKLLQETTHAKADTGVGTPAYMAPEQWLGGKISPSSDVYALGLILYQMLTGELPERRWTEQGPVPQPEAPLPPDVRAVIEKAIQSNPNRRYATAGEMVQAFLETALPHQVTARPSRRETPSEREPKPEVQENRRKTPLRPLAIGMALILAVVGLLLSGIGLQRPRGTTGKEAAALVALSAPTATNTATSTPTPTSSPSPSPLPSPTPSLTPS